MPIIEQPQDRPLSKDDRVSTPRRPSFSDPRSTIEQSKLNAEVPRCPVKIVDSEIPLPKEAKPKHESPTHPDHPPRKSEYDNIDDDRKRPLIAIEIFCQLLELDGIDEPGFSRDMVWDYFEQAEDKFNEMDKDFSSKNLLNLSSSGHFLKGSSAAIGLSRVQTTCEKIQHCGAQRDEVLDKDLSEKDALEIMDRLLKKVRLQYKEAKKWLVKFFDGDLVLPEDDVYSAE